MLLVCVVSESRSSWLRLVFFFFKQKTAYEMRISDWSSDVCSSDLRRIEDADHAHLGRRAEKVLFVTAEGIDGAGPDREDLAGFDDLDLAFAGDAIDGLEVVGVPDVGFGARLDHRVVQREAHPVALEQETTAGPVLGLDILIGAANLFERPYDHFSLPCRQNEWAGAGARPLIASGHHLVRDAAVAASIGRASWREKGG